MKKYGNKSFRAKTYTRRPRFYSRKKRSIGRIYKNNILKTTVRKKIELNYPVYINGDSAGLTFPSFDTATNQFNCVISPLSNLGSSVFTAVGTSREFVNMRKLYKLARVVSCRARYMNTLLTVPATLLNDTQMSLAITTNVPTSYFQPNTSYSFLADNWSYDGAVRYPMYNTSGRPSKWVKATMPNRLISGSFLAFGGSTQNNNNCLNQWMDTNLIPTANLNILLGAYWEGKGPVSTSIYHGLMEVNIELEFASPQTNP